MQTASRHRTTAQKDPKSPRARWCIEQWCLHLLTEQRTSEAETVGVVVSTAKGRAIVRHEGQDLRCELGREILEHQQTALAPGDHVGLEWRGHAWFVRTVRARRTVLSRLDPHLRERERAIVANVDRVVIVVSVVAPPLHPRIIDRYLAAVHLGGATASIVLNKIDLHEDLEGLAEDLRQLEPYRDMGLEIRPVSTETGEGLSALRETLNGVTSVFVGHSGVGKSSIVQALVPSAEAIAGSLSDASGRGRHTTTRSEMVEHEGMTIIDTPGIREFAVEFSSPADVSSCFEEFAEAGRCRFGDCLHLEEPGCAVREAVRTGTLSRARYRSYRRLVAEILPGNGYEDDEPPDERQPSFECRACGAEIPRAGGGTSHRNHCPRCLCSVHLDVVPGDRSACCGGVMEPIAVWVRKSGEWAIVHRCQGCGHLSSNRIASDDNDALLLSLAVRPLSKPPFPLERLGAAGALV